MYPTWVQVVIKGTGVSPEVGKDTYAAFDKNATYVSFRCLQNHGTPSEHAFFVLRIIRLYDF